MGDGAYCGITLPITGRSIPTLRRVSLVLCWNVDRGTRPDTTILPSISIARTSSAARLGPVAMAYGALYMGCKPKQSSDNFAASGSVALRHVAHRWFVENNTLGLQAGL